MWVTQWSKSRLLSVRWPTDVLLSIEALETWSVDLKQKRMGKGVLGSGDPRL